MVVDTVDGPLIFVGAMLIIIGGLVATDNEDDMEQSGWVIAIIGMVMLLIGLAMWGT